MQARARMQQTARATRKTVCMKSPFRHPSGTAFRRALVVSRRRRPWRKRREVLAMAYDERLAERIRRVLPGDVSVRERKMFGGLAFMRDGHMACGVMGPDLMLRIGPGRSERALAEAHVRRM